MPFADDSFDVIFCINVLYALPNVRKTISEFTRLLRNKGKLIIVDPQETAQFMKIFGVILLTLE